MATRCSKHPMMWQPCSICKEIEHYKLLAESAESEMKETEYWNQKLGEELDNFKDLVKEQREELNDLKRVMTHAEESAKKYAEQTCKLQAELDDLHETLKERDHDLEVTFNTTCELSTEIEELSEALEQALNSANKSYNPEAKLKLSAYDLNMVRGVFVANSFLFNSLESIKQCIENKTDEATKEQLALIQKDLEKEWKRVVDLLKVFAKEFSDSNWNRMIRETQKIVQLSVDTMNRRDLGHFTVGKTTESLAVEYNARPGVTEAVNKALSSSGTNNLTAYSKEILIQEITKMLEEK